MNNVCLIGRLTTDPGVTEVGKGRDAFTVARFTLAVDRYKSDDPDWIPVSCVGSRAEFAEKYLRKGQRVAVTGSIKTSRYEKDGVTYYTWEIYADSIEFADSKKEDQDDRKRRR